MLHFIFWREVGMAYAYVIVSNSRRTQNDGGVKMSVEKLIERGYKVVSEEEAELNMRKVVVVHNNGIFGVSFAAIDARGRYFEGGSHPPQVFRALETALWREKRDKEGPLPLKLDTITAE